jgi:hypothetical protein
VDPHGQGARTPRFPLLLPLDYELRQFINGTVLPKQAARQLLVQSAII